MIPTYDYYFCWNKSIKSDLMRIYGNVLGDNVLVTGTPQFHYHFDNNNYISKIVIVKNMVWIQKDYHFLLDQNNLGGSGERK